MSSSSSPIRYAPADLAQHWRPGHNPYLIAVVVTMATFMEVLDTSIANVALKHIAGSLSATEDESTWVLTSYLVANAVVLPLSGWFSMLFGRKRFYMTCVALFTISSALCGMAPSLGWLVAFRILQGIGGGGLQPSEQAILVDTFPPHKRGMGLAVYGVAVVVAPILGPTLGGWITDNYSWHWIFLINVPVGMLSLLLTSQLVEDPPYLPRKRIGQGLKIDYIGIGLIGVGLGCLQVVLDKGEREDWFESHFILICAVVAALGLVAALVWELRHEHPVVDVRLLKDRTFLVATFMMFMVGFVLYGSTVLLPIYTQSMLGYSATQSGMVLSPGGFATMAMMPVVGFLISRFQARWLLVVGLVVVSLSLMHMASFNTQVDFRTVMFARVFQGFGLAFLFLPINAAAFDHVPKEKNNNASALINLARNLGGSFGIAFVVTMLSRRSQFHQHMLSNHLTPYDGPFQAMLQGTKQYLMSMGSNAFDAANQANALAYGLLRRQAMMLAYIDDFWILGILFLSLVPLVLLMRKGRIHRGPAAMH